MKGTWEEATQLGAASSSRERGACGHSRSSRDAVCSWEGTSGALVNLPKSGTGAGGREARQLGRPTPPGRRAREKHSQHRRPPRALAPAPSPRAVPFPSGEGARGGRGPQPRACGAAGACPPPPPGGAPACNSARCPLSSAPARPPHTFRCSRAFLGLLHGVPGQPAAWVPEPCPGAHPAPSRRLGAGPGPHESEAAVTVRRRAPCSREDPGPWRLGSGVCTACSVTAVAACALRTPHARHSRGRADQTRGSPHGRWSLFSWLVVISNGLYPSSIS